MPSDCQPLLAGTMSGGLADRSLSGSACITSPHDIEVRLIVMFGYFFSNALTTSFIQALSTPPLK